MKKKILITKPFLPQLEEFIPFLQEIWTSRVLTNKGPMYVQLEKALCEYLDVPFISLFSNATIALITALKVLNIKGEVITTPYSFVATAHSLKWNGLTPVFVDIDKKTLNIDPNKIEAAITPKTTSIMPVHVYGHPCDVDRIEAIAKRHQLKVIYDAAHAFGVECHCGSILNHGDLSILSFHATKVYNTFEGGAIISNNAATKEKIDQLKNFGFANEISVVQTGINGKMSEFNAALGLLQLKHVDKAIEARKSIDQLYRKGLKNLVGIRCHDLPNSAKLNYGYFPIFVDEAYPLSRDELYEKLKSAGIYGRRYFYPLITDFPMYASLKNAVPIAKEISSKVLCLPIYPELKESEVEFIIDQIINPECLGK